MMGIRGEIFSTSVPLANRTYFFNVKENRLGDLYLNIVESKNRETGGFERQSVILFADDLAEFLKGFDESLRVLEKAEREKRRNAGGGGSRGRPGSGRGAEPAGGRGAGPGKRAGSGGSRGPESGRSAGPGSTRNAAPGKRTGRLVVRKKP
ncbi:MAG: DUF3276 family protein [Treponema sp.]|jgi:hypothetical protein|nr:DUF3276 family protein [Treponema sp.]